MSVLSYLVFYTILVYVIAQMPTADFPYVRTLDKNGKFVLYWNFNDTHITFEVQVRTFGYVGLGISRDGSMYPADVVLGWVNNDLAYFGENTTRIIYSFHDQDPDTEKFQLLWHGKENRGSVNLHLTQISVLPYDPTSTQWSSTAWTLDFINNNFTIHEQREAYRCIGFYLPDLGGKSHIIRFEPKIDAGNEDYIQGISLYRCNIGDAVNVSQIHGHGFNCLEAPPVIQYCKEFLAGWAPGGEGFYLPENVGISVGDSNDPVFYVLATQYKATGGPQGVKDTSGLRLTLTRSLRRQEAGYIDAGSYISWQHFLPPREPEFTTKAYCSQKCLMWGFKDTLDPMNVIGVMFKTHSLAKAVALRVIRDRTEMPWIIKDDKYSPNYQIMRSLRKPVTVQKGDRLLVECTYDTSSRTRTTLGGYFSENEVCRAYILYYPKKFIDGCLGWSSYDHLRGRFQEPVLSEDTFAYLNSTDWLRDQEMRRNLKVALATSTEHSFCYSNNQAPQNAFDHFDHPQYSIRHTAPSTCPQGAV
ncbi:hypothetical protein ACJMK2_038301 [Sinanodonta woodiana]|uniref:DOMON domain-containing protein n=1 Tax=Sinanodonta woodiana TaxID=1069815 RepID=A0ABD3W8L4_SINWO